MPSRRDVQRQQSRGAVRRTVRNTIVGGLLVLLIVISIYAIANHPRAVAKRQATTLAERYAHLNHPNGFYIYNREQTYYTVTGKNAQGQAILVIVPQRGGALQVLKQADGLTAAQARTQVQANHPVRRVLKVALGVFNDRPVWEVTYLNRQGNLCYDLLSFQSGKTVQQIDNL